MKNQKNIFMKNRVPTLEQYISESKLNESQDVDSFFAAIEIAINDANGSFYISDDSDYVIAVSNKKMNDAELEKAINAGKNTSDVQLLFAPGDKRVSPADIKKIEKSLAELKFKIDVKQLASAYL